MRFMLEEYSTHTSEIKNSIREYLDLNNLIDDFIISSFISVNLLRSKTKEGLRMGKSRTYRSYGTTSASEISEYRATAGGSFRLIQRISV